MGKETAKTAAENQPKRCENTNLLPGRRLRLNSAPLCSCYVVAFGATGEESRIILFAVRCLGGTVPKSRIQERRQNGRSVLASKQQESDWERRAQHTHRKLALSSTAGRKNGSIPDIQGCISYSSWHWLGLLELYLLAIFWPPIPVSIVCWGAM